MFSSGKNAFAICDRCGFRYPYRSIKAESGTGWRVCSTCDDGPYSLVSHPQNHLRMDWVEAESLEFPRPDVSVSA